MHYRCVAAPLRRRNGFCNCKRLRQDSCGAAIDCGKTVAVPQRCGTCYSTCNDLCDLIQICHGKLQLIKNMNLLHTYDVLVIHSYIFI